MRQTRRLFRRRIWRSDLRRSGLVFLSLAIALGVWLSNAPQRRASWFEARTAVAQSQPAASQPAAPSDQQLEPETDTAQAEAAQSGAALDNSGLKDPASENAALDPVPQEPSCILSSHSVRVEGYGQTLFCVETWFQGDTPRERVARVEEQIADIISGRIDLQSLGVLQGQDLEQVLAFSALEGVEALGEESVAGIVSDMPSLQGRNRVILLVAPADVELVGASSAAVLAAARLARIQQVVSEVSEQTSWVTFDWKPYQLWQWRQSVLGERVKPEPDTSEEGQQDRQNGEPAQPQPVGRSRERLFPVRQSGDFYNAAYRGTIITDRIRRINSAEALTVASKDAPEGSDRSEDVLLKAEDLTVMTVLRLDVNQAIADLDFFSNEAEASLEAPSPRVAQAIATLEAYTEATRQAVGEMPLSTAINGEIAALVPAATKEAIAALALHRDIQAAIADLAPSAVFAIDIEQLVPLAIGNQVKEAIALASPAQQSGDLAVQVEQAIAAVVSAEVEQAIATPDDSAARLALATLYRYEIQQRVSRYKRAYALHVGLTILLLVLSGGLILRWRQQRRTDQLYRRLMVPLLLANVGLFAQWWLRRRSRYLVLRSTRRRLAWAVSLAVGMATLGSMALLPFFPLQTLLNALAIAAISSWNALTEYLQDDFFELLIVIGSAWGAIFFIKRGVRLIPERGAYRTMVFYGMSLVVVAFAVVIASPHLPGAGTAYLAGVSAFAVLAFSLSAQATIGDVIAGFVLVFLTDLKEKNWVTIGSVTGELVEQNLFVHKVRTPKNVVVTLQNHTVLSNLISNFSTSREDGRIAPLIVHTTVTLGYDVPWRKVHQVLMRAARNTKGLRAHPAPFILQTSLDDYYVSYELNAYTDQVKQLPRIYSRLHENIQDECNHTDIEILSPHYRAVRDGSEITIPVDDWSGNRPNREGRPP